MKNPIRLNKQQRMLWKSASEESPAVLSDVTMENKITPDHLRRMAVVYIRQSSAIQLTHNLESQRRQYGLADHAKALGFINVEVGDEDLGRSGSGFGIALGIVRWRGSAT